MYATHIAVFGSEIPLWAASKKVWEPDDYAEMTRAFEGRAPEALVDISYLGDFDGKAEVVIQKGAARVRHMHIAWPSARELLRRTRLKPADQAYMRRWLKQQMPHLKGKLVGALVQDVTVGAESFADLMKKLDTFAKSLVDTHRTNESRFAHQVDSLKGRLTLHLEGVDEDDGAEEDEYRRLSARYPRKHPAIEVGDHVLVTRRYGVATWPPVKPRRAVLISRPRTVGGSYHVRYLDTNESGSVFGVELRPLALQLNLEGHAARVHLWD